MSRTLTPSGIFYFSDKGQIKTCKPEEIASLIPEDPEVYYPRGLFPKRFVTVDAEGTVQKYAVFLHKENTLWFVPQETDGSLSAKEIFIGTQHNGTVTFTQVKTVIAESWVISRCREVVDDFSIEELLKIQNNPPTSDRTTTQATIIDSKPERTAAIAVTVSTPMISTEELDSIRQKREAQRADLFALRKKLEEIEAADTQFAKPARSNSDSKLGAHISSPVTEKPSEASIKSEARPSSTIKKPRNKKALFQTVLAFTALAADLKKTTATTPDDDDEVAAASPLGYNSFSRKKSSKNLLSRENSLFICVLPEYISNTSGTPVEPQSPTQTEVDTFIHYLTTRQVVCTEDISTAVRENKFVRTLKDTIESYNLTFDFLNQLTEKNLVELLQDKNIARLKCILLWMAEQDIEITLPRLLTIIQSPALERLTHSLYLLKTNHLFNELSISWTISAHNQRYQADGYDKAFCNEAWRLTITDSFESMDSDPTPAEYDENGSYEKIEAFGSSFFKTRKTPIGEKNLFEGCLDAESRTASPTVPAPTFA